MLTTSRIKRTFNKNAASLALSLLRQTPRRVVTMILMYQMMSVTLSDKAQATMSTRHKRRGQSISICKVISLMSSMICCVMSSR